MARPDQRPARQQQQGAGPVERRVDGREPADPCGDGAAASLAEQLGDRLGVVRIEVADDLVAPIDQRQHGAVQDRLRSLRPVVDAAGLQAELEPLDDQPLDVGLRAGQEPPAVGVGAEPAGVVGQHLGGVVRGIDREAHQLHAGVGQLALQALHHAGDPGARQRAAREDERGDPDPVGQVGVGHHAARALDQPERAEVERPPAEVLAGAQLGPPEQAQPQAEPRRHDHGPQDDRDSEAIRSIHDRRTIGSTEVGAEAIH